MDDLPINEITQGDCRKVMKEFPLNSIDFVMFSPPYWGLRDYGEEAETIWGGESSCNHKWGNKIVEHQRGQVGEGNTGNHSKAIPGQGKEQEQGRFCQKCGAWRGQLGLEPDYRMYIQHLVEIGEEIKRILKPTGSWYLNLGDTYSGSGGAGGDWQEGSRSGEPKWKQGSSGDIPSKCKMLMPYRVALALIDDGWICRNDIVWEKPNPMPHSVKDRLNTTTERIFHFVKRKHYYYDLDAIREPHKSKDELERRNVLDNKGDFGGIRDDLGRSREEYYSPNGKNPGDVFEINTQPFPECHFAVYPPKLAQKPIKSSCPPKVCAKCGKPYERKVDKEQIEDYGRGDQDYTKQSVGTNPQQNVSGGFPKTKRDFKGWKKTCDCPTDKTRSGVVLDPMCGAGSTLVKAKELDRNYIGIEISEKYAEIARERLKKGDKRYKKQKRKERKRKREAEKIPNLNKFIK